MVPVSTPSTSGFIKPLINWNQSLTFPDGVTLSLDSSSKWGQVVGRQPFQMISSSAKWIANRLGMCTTRPFAWEEQLSAVTTVTPLLLGYH